MRVARPLDTSWPVNAHTSWRWVIGTAVGCQAAFGVPLAVCSWRCVPAMEWLAVLAMVTFLVAVCALLGGLLAAPLRPAYGLRVFVWGAFGLLAWILFGVVSAHARMGTLVAATVRARPLIAAIGLFERDRGAPPATLQELVPAYLPEVPTTGLAAYPQFVYTPTAEPSTAHDAARGWRLCLPCPLLMDLDALVYQPLSAGAERASTRAGERFGDWVYLND